MLFLDRNPDSDVEIDGVRRSDIPLTYAAVSADFFNVLGVRFIRGRTFSQREEQDPRQSTVIINRTAGSSSVQREIPRAWSRPSELRSARSIRGHRVPDDYR